MFTGSLHGRTALVTGATDGIGRQTALQLARRGASILLHGRDPAKVRAACDALATDTGAMPQPFIADLSSIEQVRRLAGEILDRTDRLHVLIHNAGVFLKQRRVTEDGCEMTLAVNHLAPFLLTHLLLGCLSASAPARIITVSSVAHQRGRIDLDDLHRERSYEGYGAYAGSKLANVLFAYELADRLAHTQITSNALHPGVVGTKLLREGFGTGGISVEEGAATPVFLAADSSVSNVTGKYFVDGHEAPSSPASHDRVLRARLWDLSAAITGVT